MTLAAWIFMILFLASHFTAIAVFATFMFFGEYSRAFNSNFKVIAKWSVILLFWELTALVCLAWIYGSNDKELDSHQPVAEE